MNLKKSKKFTADFETSTPSWFDKDDEARVWAYSICEIGNPENFIYGNNIDDFMKFCSGKENYTLYFHNLKFDGCYIINWLFKNGFTLAKTKEEIKSKTFTTLINDMGAFYTIEIYFEIKNHRTNRVLIMDSLKLLNFSVEKIAKDFELPIRKLELDYNEYREVGHILTAHEIDYIRNDVEIMARALKIMFDEGLDRMTIGSCALNNFKEGCKKFTQLFPILDNDVHDCIKNSYKGGFTYLNPTHKDEIVREGIVLDVNSLYPSVQRNEHLPYGIPIRYEGKYKRDMLYPLYVQVITCSFDLRAGKIPTIQLKNNLSFLPNQYLDSSNGQIVTLTLTNVDLELFLKHYRVHDLKYRYGFKFKSLSKIFSNYIDYWTEQKIESKKCGNKSRYLISKLMMNSLYGKFGTSRLVRSKYPFMSEDGVLKYEMGEQEERNPVYMPIATFITSYARRKTITTSQAIKDYTLNKYGIDYYIYSDTDSIHMLKMDEEELKKFVDVDDYRLGAWKLESSFKRGKFIRQKCYIEEDEEGVHATIAGLPTQLGKYITFENFKEGFTIKASDLEKEHKLGYKQVKGGVLLVDTDFTIK